jgi:hypothetical protein
MDRQYTHNLLDRLTPEQFEAVANLLRIMVEPAAGANPATSPDDASKSTSTDERGIVHGEGLPDTDVLRKFGL